VKEVPLSL